MPAHPLAESLLHAVPRMIQLIRAEVRLAAGREMTLTHYRILARATRAEYSLGELADELGTGMPAMSRLLDRMEKKDWIERQACADDRRRVRIRATPTGRAKFQKIRGKVALKLSERLASLSSAEEKALAAGLGMLEAIAGEPAATKPGLTTAKASAPKNAAAKTSTSKPKAASR